MGCSQSWLAVRGVPSSTVHASLGLKAAEDRTNSVFEGAELPTGWYLVIAGESGHRMLGVDAAQRLSHLSDVIIGDVEEHVMVSTTAAWRAGRQVWSVTHDSQQDVEHLVSNGELPSEYDRIREQFMLQQAAAGGRDAQVDYLFEVPVKLAFNITGYRYDADLPRVRFEPLAEGRNPLSVWWKRLLGS